MTSALPRAISEYAYTNKNSFLFAFNGLDFLSIDTMLCLYGFHRAQINLQPYDPKGSSSGKLVMCSQEFCISTTNAPVAGCKQNMLCEYNVVYGDGSSTAGYFVEDYVHLDQVTGNLHSSLTNASVKFG